MNNRVFRRNDPIIQKKRRKPLVKGPTEKWCRPKLIYAMDGKSVLTTSKWFKNPMTCVYDWYSRGFIVIQDEAIGGGFDFRDFPVIDTEKLTAILKEKFDE